MFITLLAVTFTLKFATHLTHTYFKQHEDTIWHYYKWKKHTEESKDHENIDYNVIIYSHVFPLCHIVKITWLGVKDDEINKFFLICQQNPDTDPTPENEARKSLLAHAKSRPDSQSLEGKRLVSDREWMLLQEEVSWSFWWFQWWKNASCNVKLSNENPGPFFLRLWENKKCICFWLALACYNITVIVIIFIPYI